MKIVKRDGRIVDYDKSKIIIAIKKANADVDDKEKINDKKIDKIVLYIESLNKKRLLVEDIQDIIETKLMEAKKYVLAKAYIVYRYNRALVNDGVEHGVKDPVRKSEEVELPEIHRGADALERKCERDHSPENLRRAHPAVLRKIILKNLLLVKARLHSRDEEKRRRKRHHAQTAYFHKCRDDPEARAAEYFAEVQHGKSRDADGRS